MIVLNMGPYLSLLNLCLMLTPYESEHFLSPPSMCLCSHVCKRMWVCHVQPRVGVGTLLQSFSYFDWVSQPNPELPAPTDMASLTSLFALGIPSFKISKLQSSYPNGKHFNVWTVSLGPIPACLKHSFSSCRVSGKKVKTYCRVRETWLTEGRV